MVSSGREEEESSAMAGGEDVGAEESGESSGESIVRGCVLSSFFFWFPIVSGLPMVGQWWRTRH